MYHDDEDQNEHEDFVSKSQLKREAHARQSLGAELVELNEDQLQKFNLSADLLQAVKLAQTIKQRGARKRQLQFIGKLMREVDIAPIQQKLDDLKGISARAIATQHAIEHWRQRLLEEGDEALQQLLEQWPTMDRQQLRQMIRSAQKELQTNKPPKAFRALFKYLREFIE
jgi:ribosome-associated protein